MPSSGPLRPAITARSAARAAASAWRSVTSRKALSCGSSAAIRSSSDRVSSTGESFFAAIRRPASAMVRNGGALPFIACAWRASRRRLACRTRRFAFAFAFGLGGGGPGLGAWPWRCGAGLARRAALRHAGCRRRRAGARRWPAWRRQTEAECHVVGHRPVVRQAGDQAGNLPPRQHEVCNLPWVEHQPGAGDQNLHLRGADGGRRVRRQRRHSGRLDPSVTVRNPNRPIAQRQAGLRAFSARTGSRRAPGLRLEHVQMLWRQRRSGRARSPGARPASFTTSGLIRVGAQMAVHQRLRPQRLDQVHVQRQPLRQGQVLRADADGQLACRPARRAVRRRTAAAGRRRVAPRCPSRARRAGRKFIAGAPMKPAT